MKERLPRILEAGRIVKGPMASPRNFGWNGCFFVKRRGQYLRLVISDQLGWEHVSVSTETRIPSWLEMCFVKDLCFDENEIVMQLHPAKKDYVNDNPYTLHLWKPQNQEIPLPPKSFV